MSQAFRSATRSLYTTLLCAISVATSPAAWAQKPTPPPPDSAEEAAQKAADSWLKLVDGAQYSDSWDSASSLFRKAVTKSDWNQAVAQVRGPLEPFGARTLQSRQYTTTLGHAPPGQYVVMVYRTSVANGGHVIETVTMMKEDSRWRNAGYRVRPD